MSKKGRPIFPKADRSRVTEAQVRDALRGVYDPELGQNLVDLNMVRKVEIEHGKVKVGLVLTAPGCPLAALIVAEAQRAVEKLPDVKEAVVELLDEPYQQPDADDWDEWLWRAFGRR